jgi:hypothetical protein
MSTIFPSNPSINDEFGRYRWDGTAWVIIGIDLTYEYAELTNGLISENVIPVTIARVDDVTTSLGEYIPLDTKGEPLGVAELDANGHVPSSQLSISLDGYATETYVGTAISNLVGGAPELLDTLNELAAAINDDENFATTVSSAISAKQDALTAGTNINIVDSTISVTGLDTDDVSEGASLYFTDARARTALSADLGGTNGGIRIIAPSSTADATLSNDSATHQVIVGPSGNGTNVKGTLTILASPSISDPGNLGVAGYIDATGSITGSSIIKDGGTSSEFLKADGSVDTNTYLTSFTETDPVFIASEAYNISSTDTNNWDTAYGWGDHESAGYLTTSSASTTYAALSGATFTGALTATYPNILSQATLNNTKIGSGSLSSITTGTENVACGYNSMSFNEDGNSNTAIGSNSLLGNLDGDNNVAIGYLSGDTNTSGNDNVYIGLSAGSSNYVASFNVAIGSGSLATGIDAANSVAIGANALNLSGGDQNVAIGYGSGSAITTGNYNVVIGNNSGSTIASLSNNIILSDGQGNIRLQFDSSGNAKSAGSIVSHIEFNQQTASYTATLQDDGKIVEINNGSANTFTIPLNSSVPFPIGTQINIIQTGVGQTTVTPISGVTINATPGLKLRTQYSTATAIKRGTNTWILVGDIVA